MTNQLIPYNEVEQFGKAMVASNYFSDAKSISQAVVKIQAGAELGLPPFASMTGIHIIKGKPVLGANVLATLVKNDPRYDYKVKVMSDDMVTIGFYENGAMVGESSFSADDAKKAGTQNMGKFPRNMLFARAMSNGAKWYTPGIFGGMPVYTPEDFDMQVDEDGAIVEGAIVQPEPDIEHIYAVKEPSPAMMRKLHAIGVQKFGKEWDEARHVLINDFTSGRTESSKELSYDEVIEFAGELKKIDDYVAPEEKADELLAEVDQQQLFDNEPELRPDGGAYGSV